jgi:hypothetical protein
MSDELKVSPMLSEIEQAAHVFIRHMRNMNAEHVTLRYRYDSGRTVTVRVTERNGDKNAKREAATEG